MTAFADPFPADVFLNAVNLPAEDTPLFVRLGARRVRRPQRPGPQGRRQRPGRDARLLQGMFDKRRHAAPGPRGRHPHVPAVEAEVDGKPIPEDDLLNMAVVLVLAGLDTTKSQLGYNFHHLATHPEDRARLVADP